MSESKVSVVVIVPDCVETDEEYSEWSGALSKARELARNAVASGLSLQVSSELAAEHFTDKGIIGWHSRYLADNTEAISSKLAFEQDVGN